MDEDKKAGDSDEEILESDSDNETVAQSEEFLHRFQTAGHDEKIRLIFHHLKLLEDDKDIDTRYNARVGFDVMEGMIHFLFSEVDQNDAQIRKHQKKFLEIAIPIFQQTFEYYHSNVMLKYEKEKDLGLGLEEESELYQRAMDDRESICKKLNCTPIHRITVTSTHKFTPLTHSTHLSFLSKNFYLSSCVKEEKSYFFDLKIHDRRTENEKKTDLKSSGKYHLDHLRFYYTSKANERAVILHIPKYYKFEFIDLGNDFCLTSDPFFTGSRYLVYFRGKLFNCRQQPEDLNGNYFYIDHNGEKIQQLDFEAESRTYKEVTVFPNFYALLGSRYLVHGEEVVNKIWPRAGQFRFFSSFNNINHKSSKHLRCYPEGIFFYFGRYVILKGESESEPPQHIKFAREQGLDEGVEKLFPQHRKWKFFVDPLEYDHWKLNHWKDMKEESKSNNSCNGYLNPELVRVFDLEDKRSKKRLFQCLYDIQETHMFLGLSRVIGNLKDRRFFYNKSKRGGDGVDTSLGKVGERENLPFHRLFSKTYRDFLVLLYLMNDQLDCEFSKIPRDVLDYVIIPMISEQEIFWVHNWEIQKRVILRGLDKEPLIDFREKRVPIPIRKLKKETVEVLLSFQRFEKIRKQTESLEKWRRYLWDVLDSLIVLRRSPELAKNLILYRTGFLETVETIDLQVTGTVFLEAEETIDLQVARVAEGTKFKFSRLTVDVFNLLLRYQLKDQKLQECCGLCNVEYRLAFETINFLHTQINHTNQILDISPFYESFDLLLSENSKWMKYDEENNKGEFLKFRCLFHEKLTDLLGFLKGNSIGEKNDQLPHVTDILSSRKIAQEDDKRVDLLLKSYPLFFFFFFFFNVLYTDHIPSEEGPSP